MKQIQKETNINRCFKGSSMIKQRTTMMANKFSWSKFRNDLPKWAITIGKRMSESLTKKPYIMTDGMHPRKGYMGTPLPLLPDIRKAEVSVGTLHPVLDSFGITKKVGGEVHLYPGPNRKLNQYLIHEYKRMIKTIGGKVVELKHPVSVLDPLNKGESTLPDPTTLSY